MSYKAMGASSPMCDLLVVRCSNIFCALHHSWRGRCRNIFPQSIRTLPTAEYLPCWHAPQECTAVPGPSLGTIPNTYLGATPVVRDSLLRPAPFVASAVCLTLIALSILRCARTPCPVALGPTPLPKGTTSKGGGRCLGEPHAWSHSGPMHIGEDVQEPTPLPTSHAQ